MFWLGRVYVNGRGLIVKGKMTKIEIHIQKATFNDFIYCRLKKGVMLVGISVIVGVSAWFLKEVSLENYGYSVYV